MAASSSPSLSKPPSPSPMKSPFTLCGRNILNMISTEKEPWGLYQYFEFYPERFKWGTDESSLHRITEILCLGVSDLLVLPEGHRDHPMLRHLADLADFMRVTWVTADARWTSVVTEIRGEPVLAWTLTGDSIRDDFGPGELTGKLNSNAYPLAEEAATYSLMVLIEEAVEENMLEWGVDKVTKALGSGNSELVILAADADPYEVLIHLPSLADFKDVPFVFVPSQEEIGTHVGLSRSISACCVTKKQGPRLNSFLAMFRASFPVMRRLPHWNGLPEIVEPPVVLHPSDYQEDEDEESSSSSSSEESSSSDEDDHDQAKESDDDDENAKVED